MKLPWPGPLLPGASQPVWIRTASEGDLGSLAQYFEGLSRSARYNRFMGAASNFATIARGCLVPTRKADWFTLFVETREPHGDAIIGEACYGFDRTHGTGEFAMSVADRFRRRGLGSALLCALQSRAISLGCLDLFGETLKGNDEMRSLARKAGFKFTRSPDWRAVRFDKRLAD
ncbi:MAG TPA: GNAT family N-acetyltransferase [Bradyrhizobium sp.]|jgi:GNAT superfamily N-acetyltransferase|nr:GNAT family N-acetyltransferase [Bradyrhizobium sp.]